MSTPPDEQTVRDEARMQARWRALEDKAVVTHWAHALSESLAFAIREAGNLLDGGADGVDRLTDPWQRTTVEIVRDTLQQTRKALRHHMTLAEPTFPPSWRIPITGERTR